MSSISTDKTDKTEAKYTATYQEPIITQDDDTLYLTFCPSSRLLDIDDGPDSTYPSDITDAAKWFRNIENVVKGVQRQVLSIAADRKWRKISKDTSDSDSEGTQKGSDLAHSHAQRCNILS